MLAEAIGVTIQTISNIENAVKGVDFKTISALAAALDCEETDLFSDAESEIQARVRKAREKVLELEAERLDVLNAMDDEMWVCSKVDRETEKHAELRAERDYLDRRIPEARERVKELESVYERYLAERIAGTLEARGEDSIVAATKRTDPAPSLLAQLTDPAERAVVADFLRKLVAKRAARKKGGAEDAG